MVIKKWLPLMIMLAGMILLATGLWQYFNDKIQTRDTLNSARQLLAGPLQPGNPKEKGKTNSKPINAGDIIGILEIPKIDAELPIVEGTNADDLKKGVGHFNGSSLPGQHGQIVLSGHRDTVFSRLGELKIGDLLKVKIPKGTFTYQITHTKIVASKDTSIITLQKKQEELILTTCYPFRYIGNAPKRYIIYAKPV